MTQELPPTSLPFSTRPLSTIHCYNKKLCLFKAPESDSIPNVVLKCTSKILVLLLHTCLCATLSLQYHPKAWWTWTTIVLKTPGKADYTVAKVYCPVALYNIMGKTVSAVMTDMLVYLTVQYNLLQAKCFGGLPGHTTSLQQTRCIPCQQHKEYMEVAAGSHYCLSGHCQCFPQCHHN